MGGVVDNKPQPIVVADADLNTPETHSGQVQ